MKIIKDYYSVLEEPLPHFVTRVIETQDYPQAIKVSRVVPLLKAPDLNTTDCKSYRPVNILPALSKVAEKVIFSQIQNHIDANDILPPNLHGSRVGHTTTTAIIEMYEAMIEAYENGQVATLVSLDQILAYDLIDNFIMKERLRIIGAKEKTVALLASYLEGRSQYVKLETNSSPRLKKLTVFNNPRIPGFLLNVHHMNCQSSDIPS